MGAVYVDVEKARGLSGLRLALTTGVPGPWGEAAKGIFRAKGIPFTRVAQTAGADNEALFAWTGHRNAPIAVYENEPPRTTWPEILFLAERLRPEPALVPANADERVLCFGIAQDLMGENGFGWCRRLMLLRLSMGDSDNVSEAMRPVIGRLVAQYGYSRSAAEQAPERAAQILELLSRRLAAQRAAGRHYLIGDRLSAADIYWAAMAALVAPLPADVCPMPESLRGLYADPGPRVAKALDPALLAHRDRIYREHMEYPVAL